MNKSALIAFSVYLFFSIQGCSQSVNSQQTTTSLKDTLIVEVEQWYDESKDTVMNIGNKQILIKTEIVSIPEKFIIQKSYGDDGKEYISKIPDTEIRIQISDNQFKLQKQDIPDLSSEFLSRSVFQQINIYSITEESSIFEIMLGEMDTDDIVLVSMTIDSNRKKSFKIEYPEWEEE